jgi:hypothetical protein
LKPIAVVWHVLIRLHATEKSSWMSLAPNRSPVGSGHWRSVTCRLLEEGDKCLLHIYLDVSVTLSQFKAVNPIKTSAINFVPNGSHPPAESNRYSTRGLFPLSAQGWSRNLLSGVRTSFLSISIYLKVVSTTVVRDGVRPIRLSQSTYNLQAQT